jgi:hypothetical protein
MNRFCRPSRQLVNISGRCLAILSHSNVRGFQKTRHVNETNQSDFNSFIDTEMMRLRSTVLDDAKADQASERIFLGHLQSACSSSFSKEEISPVRYHSLRPILRFSFVIFQLSKACADYNICYRHSRWIFSFCARFQLRPHILNFS